MNGIDERLQEFEALLRLLPPEKQDLALELAMVAPRYAVAQHGFPLPEPLLEGQRAWEAARQAGDTEWKARWEAERAEHEAYLAALTSTPASAQDFIALADRLPTGLRDAWLGWCTEVTVMLLRGLGKRKVPEPTRPMSRWAWEAARDVTRLLNWEAYKGKVSR